MAAILTLARWFEHGNEPQSADDADDLLHALQGDSRGSYKAEEKANAFRLLTGPGSKALLFKVSESQALCSEVTARYRTEAGAAIHGDAILERAMKKRD